MKIKFLLVLVGIITSSFMAATRKTAVAQVQSDWATPLRLSKEDHTANEAALVADPYGNLHVFWAEILDDDRGLLQYARFDGQIWTAPVNIRYTPPLMDPKSISPFIDRDDTLHVAWISLQNGPAVYTKVPVLEAGSAQNWAEGKPIRVPANELQLVVDQEGTVHVVYQVVSPDFSQPGVYYIKSEDEGLTWSNPLWLDTDIPDGFVPRTVKLKIDNEGALHAMWFYVTVLGSDGDWIRYAHSMDGGVTWSRPTTIARNRDGDDLLTPLSGPIMAISGREVHIVWAAGDLLYRHHRYSQDGGETWSMTRRIFGDLNGQAGDSLSVDGSGAVHFVGQIRFPKAIYHSYWTGSNWSKTEMIYSIQVSDDETPLEKQVEAHDTNAEFRAGNELVVTFADPPPTNLRQLFVTSRLLAEVPAQSVLHTPTAVLPPTSEPATPTTPTPYPVQLPLSFDNVTSDHSGWRTLLEMNPIAVSAGAVAILLFMIVSGLFLARMRS